MCSDTQSDGGSQVGPVLFSHEVARDQLLREGIVATFRTDRRTTGETHARWERTGEKKADVVVRELSPDAVNIGVDEEDGLPWFEFGTYAEWSGFGTPHAWHRAIQEVHGDDTEEGWIYEVELVENDLLACVACEGAAPVCVCEGGQCPNCHGKGHIVNCLDDICHNRGDCMHGNNEDCPRCTDGLVYPKRVPWEDLDGADCVETDGGLLDASEEYRALSWFVVGYMAAIDSWVAGDDARPTELVDPTAALRQATDALDRHYEGDCLACSRSGVVLLDGLFCERCYPDTESEVGEP